MSFKKLESFIDAVKVFLFNIFSIFKSIAIKLTVAFLVIPSSFLSSIPIFFLFSSIFALLGGLITLEVFIPYKLIDWDKVANEVAFDLRKQELARYIKPKQVLDSIIYSQPKELEKEAKIFKKAFEKENKVLEDIIVRGNGTLKEYRNKLALTSLCFAIFFSLIFQIVKDKEQLIFNKTLKIITIILLSGGVYYGLSFIKEKVSSKYKDSINLGMPESKALIKGLVLHLKGEPLEVFAQPYKKEAGPIIIKHWVPHEVYGIPTLEEIKEKRASILTHYGLKREWIDQWHKKQEIIKIKYLDLLADLFECAKKDVEFLLRGEEEKICNYKIVYAKELTPKQELCIKIVIEQDERFRARDLAKIFISYYEEYSKLYIDIWDNEYVLANYLFWEAEKHPAEEKWDSFIRINDYLDLDNYGLDNYEVLTQLGFLSDLEFFEEFEKNNKEEIPFWLLGKIRYDPDRKLLISKAIMSMEEINKLAVISEELSKKVLKFNSFYKNSLCPIVLSDYTYAFLKKLPQEVQFPESIKNRIRYDDYLQLLIFKGLMKENEYNELLKLSQDSAYQNAVKELFSNSQIEEWEFIPHLLVCVRTGAYGHEILNMDNPIEEIEYLDKKLQELEEKAVPLRNPRS